MMLIILREHLIGLDQLLPLSWFPKIFYYISGLSL